MNSSKPPILLDATAFPYGACAGCHDNAPLPFDFEYAYQPIVDLATRSIYGHEALVRGPNGESAASVLSQVNDDNRYRFDQACRVKAVAGAAKLGMQGYLSINFLPNAVYRPEVCIRSTLEAARKHNFPTDKIIFEVTEGEKYTTGRTWSISFGPTAALASRRRLMILAPVMQA